MLLSLWLFLAVAPTGPGPAPAPPRTTFSGHLEHAPPRDTVRLFVGERRVKMALSPSGDFRFEFSDLTTATPVHFAYAGQQTRLYLLPGNQLVMRLDFRDFDKTLAYSGRGADLNNYLAQAQYKFEYGPPGDVPRPLDELKPTTTPAELRHRADAFRQARRAFLTQYAQAHPLAPAQRRDAEFSIDLTWGTQLLDYLAYHAAHPSVEAGLAAPVEPGYFDFIAQLPLQELGQHLGRGLDENTAVARFLVGYQSRLAPSGRLPLDPAQGPRLYQQATQELGDGKVRDLAMQILMSWKLADDLPGALAFYPTFKLHNRDSTLARNVRQSIAKHLILGEGKSAPAFTLLDNTGKKVSLSGFKGKVVYLDFWGTWCGPCMREMTEFSHALKKQFEGRDVVFLYVSEGDPEDRWQQTLAAKQLLSANSVHLREPRENTTVATDYQVSAYPTYWLISRDGRILDMAAPRPSDGVKTVVAIEAALKK